MRGAITAPPRQHASSPCTPHKALFILVHRRSWGIGGAKAGNVPCSRPLIAEQPAEVP